MNFLKKSTWILLLTTLFTSPWCLAGSFAITNATVHTVTEQGVLKNATVVVENGKITAINPEKLTADKIIDAKGQILTPGFIGSLSQIGLVEVSAVANTRDMSDDKADITFDASLAFNPKSSVIPYTRKGGITSVVVTPYGGKKLFKGKAFAVNLSGQFDSVRNNQLGLVVSLGAERKGSRALNLQKLINELADTQKKLTKKQTAKKKAKKKDNNKDKNNEPSRTEQLMFDLLQGKITLIAYVDRATDILALLKLKEQYALDLVLASAADAVLVSDAIAQANVPVVMGALDNLPESFDSLHKSLDNAAKLTAAGVKLVFAFTGDTHQLYQLRYHAGNAVANGVSKADALAAVTANVADAFHLDGGRIAVGQTADLVLWNDDPFELSSRVVTLWIDGQEYSTQSRQDKLRDRYMQKNDMPFGYNK